jgi:hypothetical protein
MNIIIMGLLFEIGTKTYWRLYVLDLITFVTASEHFQNPIGKWWKRQISISLTHKYMTRTFLALYMYFSMIDWCFTPTLAIFQLYRGVHFSKPHGYSMDIEICLFHHFPIGFWKCSESVVCFSILLHLSIFNILYHKSYFNFSYDG